MKIFIGSTTEKSNILNEICAIVESMGEEAVPWNSGLFYPGSYTLPRLIEIAREEINAAILIYSSDDSVNFRGTEVMKPRDNVVFEHGLFTGIFGKERAIIVKVDEPAKPATDLDGLTYIPYYEKSKSTGKLLIGKWIERLKMMENEVEKKLLGVTKISKSLDRDADYRAIREKAQNKLIIVGVGMKNLAFNMEIVIPKIAENMPIELFMINPEVLTSNRNFSKKVEEFFGEENFTKRTLKCFNNIKTFCQAWNSNPKNLHKIYFRVFDSLPTFSMVMIDPDHDYGRIMIEFFITKGDGYRPRMEIKKTIEKESLFQRIHLEYQNLLKNSKPIEPLT